MPGGFRGPPGVRAVRWSGRALDRVEGDGVAELVQRIDRAAGGAFGVALGAGRRTVTPAAGCSPSHSCPGPGKGRAGACRGKIRTPRNTLTAAEKDRGRTEVGEFP
ncbi:hypothetical protein SVIO_099430 [Streptomyces violaceusniger]|uniref:Uncharacterized protein n=1 Tax=Streptomyces violaceusniger TaxID=68280 RepID=A0A4D4LJC6_STRVO|nr:hypothetical protein SVIO_099430 [Streptomyces violaceusniger]